MSLQNDYGCLKIPLRYIFYREREKERERERENNHSYLKTIDATSPVEDVVFSSASYITNEI